MSETSDKYSAAFKARVVLEAMKASETDSSIAKAYGIHPVTLSRWKQQLQKEAVAIFGESEALMEIRAHQERLQHEVDRLRKENSMFRAACDGPIDLITKIAIVNAIKDEFGLNRVCELLGIPKSTYYYHLNDIEE